MELLLRTDAVPLHCTEASTTVDVCEALHTSVKQANVWMRVRHPHACVRHHNRAWRVICAATRMVWRGRDKT